MSRFPPCKWAQRKDRIMLTIDLTDATDVTVSFEEKKMIFKGSGKASGNKSDYNNTINLFNEIVPADCTYKVSSREIQINLIKKEKGFWDRMTEDPSKVTKQWLSCDWSRWKDEDDAEDAADRDFGYGNMDDMDFGAGGEGGDSDDEEPPADLGDLDTKDTPADD